MKQFQFDYHSITTLKRDLDKISLWCKTKNYSGVLFQIFSKVVDRGQIELVMDIITQCIPEAHCMGCSTTENIIDGGVSCNEISIVCTIFEYPTTKFKLLQYTFTAENCVEVAKAIKEETQKNSWVKAIEMMLTITSSSMSPFCNVFADLDPSIAIFGGCAYNETMAWNNCCVFSKEKGYSENGIVVVLYGGEDFNVFSKFITGWKPLGKEFKITKAEGEVLKEIDGKSPYDIYYHYLNILKDQNFFFNCLEFPLIFKHNGIDILRVPMVCRDNGEIELSADIDEGTTVRLAYGDPWTILKSVHEDCKEFSNFNPEIIRVYSCAARKTFWGKEEISGETSPFQAIAATSGFCTAGEFLRTGKYLNLHNVTLVVSAMREGYGGDPIPYDTNHDLFKGKVSMVNRLATFINAATKELAEANLKLLKAATIDTLSELYNRGEIQRRIKEIVSHCKDVKTLVMLDIDNFKNINDTFGHQEGDNVIKTIASLMNAALEKTEGCAGRWGGEEFMILLPHVGKEAAISFAEDLRKKFALTNFELSGKQTTSIGVTEILENESAEDALARADKALYTAKKNGKNQVIAL